MKVIIQLIWYDYMTIESIITSDNDNNSINVFHCIFRMFMHNKQSGDLENCSGTLGHAIVVLFISSQMSPVSVIGIIRKQKKGRQMIEMQG
jgi:hypothetical protein